jgi:hypothetical protein
MCWSMRDSKALTRLQEHSGRIRYVLNSSTKSELIRQEMKKLNSAILPNITSRQHQIISEFSFWPSSPPRDSGYPDGGVFEMRTYQLQPGTLLQWEHAWRRGLEARRKFVVRLCHESSSQTCTYRSATCWSLLLSSWSAARSSPYLAVPVSTRIIHPDCIC